MFFLLWRQGSNLRPPGYESAEQPPDDSKSLPHKAGGSYYCVKYSGEIALKSVLCAVAEHHARQPKRHIGEERQNRQHR